MSPILPTTCTICNCECGLMAEVGDGRVLRVRGDPRDPHNRGALCPKGKLSNVWASAPNRLLHPLVRKGKSGAMVETSWDEALDLIANRLSNIMARYGPAAVAFYYGSSPNFLSRIFYDALARWLGTPNAAGTWSLCVGPKVLGYESVFGRTGSFARADFANAGMIVLWGANPSETGMHRYGRLWADILSARKKGGRLVVIDPRPTRTARAADRHLAIKPGTDHILAVALIKLLLDGDMADRSYLSGRAEGLSALTAALDRFDPEAAVERTGLSWNRVRELALDLGTRHPAVVDRREGVIHQINGSLLSRAIAVINALVGGVDVKGGLLFGNGRPLSTGLGVPDRRSEKPLWHTRFPCAKDAAALFIPAILHGRPRPVRALFAACGNPVSAWPDTSRTLAAMRKLDFLVVNDIFPTETTAIAHVILPGATFFEKGGMSAGPFKLGWWMKTSAPLISPPGLARPEWRVAADLARLLGCETLSNYRNEDAVFSRILADSGLRGLDPRDLRRGRMLEENRPGRYLEDGFPTPTGRLALFRDAFGRSIFSEWLNPADACPPEAEYPLRLITGARVVGYYHSQQRNVPAMNRLAPEPVVEIAPQTAASAGVSDGQWVAVVTRHGRIELPAAVTPGMEVSTVSVPHGWPGPANANTLVGAEPLEALAATPTYRAMPCRLEKATRSGLQGGRAGLT